MKNIGRILIVIAMAVIILPWFTECEAHGNRIALPNGKTIPMICHWTGRAELAVAGTLAAAGLLMLLEQRRETHRALSFTTAVLGTSVILLPTVLIGVCANEMMLCNMVMRPSLVMAGIFVIVASIVGIVRSRPAMQAA